MDIQELRYFLAAYEDKSYSQAALKLFISRQALRQKILHLEKELGAPLFAADGKSLIPTDMGERLYDECRHIVCEFDAMEKNLKAYTKSIQGKVNLILGFGAISFLRPDTLMGFQKLHPGTRLQIAEDADTSVIAAIVAGHKDLGIVGATASLLEGVDALKIQSNTMYVLIHKQNPLYELEQIRPEDLTGQDFVSFGEQNHSHLALCKECAEKNSMPNFIFSTYDFNSGVIIARRHKAITWSYPPYALSYNIPDFHIARLLLSDTSWGTYIISKTGKALSPVSQLLVQHLQTAAANI